MKKIILFTSLWVSTLATSAQESIFQIGWDVAIPTGDLKEEYIDEVSFRGVTIGGRKFLTDFFSVGGKGGWQTFYTRFDGTYEVDENTDLTGTQLRYLNVYPIQANFHYYLGEDEGIRPYLGANFGIVFANQRTDIGIFTVGQNSTHFGVSPEVGILIPVGLAGGGVILSGKYEQAFKTNKTNIHIQYFSVNLNFMFAN